MTVLSLCPDLVFAEDSYLDHLLKISEREQLYNDRYWKILLHYKDTLFGVESLIDDPRFFLSHNGKTDPQKELVETLKGFFIEDNMGDEHPQCRFIARYSWLKEKLSIEESRLPRVECKGYRDAADKIMPKSAVMVFPSAHMNMPASMFGHTLIRVDNKFQSRLLSYAINYSAITEDTGGISYIFKGLFGYYKGYFSILPYYEKIKEYNDIEQRDMWEYNLNLSDEELQRMLMHLWELKEIYSYYYFFDENCSYNILFLLEAARPSLNLTDWRPWIIPIDTVRSIKEDGLVDSVNYRPSKGTIINYIASQINKAEQKLTIKIINDEAEPEGLINSNTIGEEEKINILDLASEMVQYKYFKGELLKEEYLKRFLNILNIRSRLGKAENGPYNLPLPPDPENGHRSYRLALGTGIKKDKTFLEMRLRPAYHDLLDPDQGYIEGSQIVFTDLRLRYYFKEKRFKFEGIDFIDIVSIAPINEFFKPRSWKMSTGITHKIHRDGADQAVYYLNAGYGLTYKDKIAGLYYTFAESEINIGKKLDDKYSLGIGATIGFLKTFNDIWKVNVNLGATYYAFGERHKTYKGTLDQNFRINTNNSITLSLARMKTYDIYSSETKINWNLYF